MTSAHLALAVGVLAANGAAGALGAISWLRRAPSRAFWPLLRVAQVAVVAEALVGVGLMALGRRAPDGLHLLYGVAPLVVSLVTEAMRVGAAAAELEEVDDLEGLGHREQVAVARRVVLRETGVMTIGCLLIVTLALRAYVSGG